MKNLYNLGWGLALCSLLGACQSDGIPEVEAGSTLELRSVSLADDAVTKAVTTSVDNVKLYLKNSSDTWVNPVYSKSGVTWGCESAPLLGSTATDVYAYYPTEEEGKAINVTASSRACTLSRSRSGMRIHSMVNRSITFMLRRFRLPKPQK